MSFPSQFRPRLLDTMSGYRSAGFFKDMAAGITVGIVALPLAIAIAIASGMPPASGVWAAIIGGLLVGVLGGSNVLIAGSANAFIVVVYGIVLAHGVNGLLLATLMAGVLMIVMALLRLGRLIQHVPDALIEGFTSAIAVILFTVQLKDALGLPIVNMPADVWGMVLTIGQSVTKLNGASFLLSLGTIGVMVVWNKAARRSMWMNRIPATMVALLGLSIIAFAFKLPAQTIGSRFGAAFAEFQHLPAPHWPTVPLGQWPSLIVPAFTLAVLSAIESLLCARVADDLNPQLPRHAPNQELFAQGVANMAVPLVGGLPVTGTIARTLTNMRSGGHTPVASIVHALTLLAIMLIAAPLAVHIPLAVLAGILLYLAWGMFGWKEFAEIHRKPREFSAVLLVTFIFTLALSLTWGIAAGLLVSWLIQRAMR